MRPFPKINIPIEISNSLRKKFAEKWESHPVIVFAAPCGFGKTTAARALLEDKSVYYIDAFAGFEARELVGARNSDCLVVDNAQELDDDYLVKCIRSLVDSCPQIHLLVLTRGAVPAWIVSYRIRGLVAIFGEEDFRFDAVTTKHLVNDYGASIDSSDLKRLLENANGYPLAIAIVARRMADGEPYDRALGEKTAGEVHDFFITEMFGRLDMPTRQLLVKLSLFKSFTFKLACAITNDERASTRLERLRKTNSAFEGDPERKGAYRMKGLWLRALRGEAEKRLTSEEIVNIYETAGEFYSKHGEVARALSCYEKAGRKDMIRQQLIDNTRHLVSLGSYRSAEPYYLQITREEVLSSPLLIYGMSLLCSLQMRPQEGERWREALLDYAADESNPEEKRKDARVRYAYLRLLLPQFKTDTFLEPLLEVCHVLDETGIKPPTCSITSGAPGLLGGIHDFSALLRAEGGDLSCYEDEFGRVFGSEGRFFARFAGIEYAFGRGELKKSQLHELSRALPAVRRERLYDMEFALTSLIARGELSFGKPQAALEVIDAMLATFSKREETLGLLERTKTLRCRIALYTSNEAVVSEWLANDAAPLFAPPLPERSYLYMTQALAYVARGEYRKALYAIDAVEGSYVADERVLNSIFAKAVTAICQYQLQGEWQEELQKAIDIADEYGFIMVLSQFGSIMQTMLSNCEYEASKEFSAKLAAFAAGEDYTFPNFFKEAMVLENPLTQTEQQVLELLCEDMSNADIGKAMGIKIPTVKTHVSHIFAKLNCKRRSEARSIALSLGLV